MESKTDRWPHLPIAADRPRLLAVFAHPDDETFLAGATLATYAARGWDVRLVCATRGERGKRGAYLAVSTGTFADVRTEELKAACESLGIGPPDFLDCPDGEVDACGRRARDAVAQVLHTFAPNVVITFGPDGVSGHSDHLAIHRVVTAAFHEWRNSGRPAYGADTALYYVLRSAAVPACCVPRGPEAPPLTTVIAVGSVGRSKLAAVRCHVSQTHLQPTEEPANVARILKSPEHFHRAWPPWHERSGVVEADLFPRGVCVELTDEAAAC